MKKKVSFVFYCKNCGNESPKWQGKCSYCGEWNSIIEKKISNEAGTVQVGLQHIQVPALLKLNEVGADDNVRMHFTDEEFNRIMGGGLMTGSITLAAGEPGIGKSTLFLQLGLSEKKKHFISVVKKAHIKSKKGLTV